MSTDPVVIASFARTPMGGFQGVFAPVKATELGAAAVRAAVERAGVEPEAVEQAAATHAPATASEPQPQQDARRIRQLIFTDPGAAVKKLVRHFRGPAPASSITLAQPPAPTWVNGPPPSPQNTPVETVLESYGYIWWADAVRRRRKSAEHCIPGRMY